MSLRVLTIREFIFRVQRFYPITLPPLVGSYPLEYRNTYFRSHTVWPDMELLQIGTSKK